MSETFAISPPPDDLTRVIDKNGTEWTLTDEGRWNNGISGVRWAWGSLLAWDGPVTRVPEPPVPIPAERWNVAKLVEVYQAHYSYDMARGLTAVLAYLRDGTE